MADTPAGERLAERRDRLRQRRASLDRPERGELTEFAAEVDVIGQDDEVPDEPAQRLREVRPASLGRQAGCGLEEPAGRQPERSGGRDAPLEERPPDGERRWLVAVEVSSSPSPSAGRSAAVPRASPRAAAGGRATAALRPRCPRDEPRRPRARHRLCPATRHAAADVSRNSTTACRSNGSPRRAPRRPVGERRRGRAANRRAGTAPRGCRTARTPRRPRSATSAAGGHDRHLVEAHARRRLETLSSRLADLCPLVDRRHDADRAVQRDRGRRRIVGEDPAACEHVDGAQGADVGRGCSYFLPAKIQPASDRRDQDGRRALCSTPLRWTAQARMRRDGRSGRATRQDASARRSGPRSRTTETSPARPTGRWRVRRGTRRRRATARPALHSSRDRPRRCRRPCRWRTTA